MRGAIGDENIIEDSGCPGHGYTGLYHLDIHPGNAHIRCDSEYSVRAAGDYKPHYVYRAAQHWFSHCQSGDRFPAFPYGLPMAAAWLIAQLMYFRDWIKEAVY